MDTVLQAQFGRVETALSSLVDSIATFNPSPQAALDLVAADDELSSGLDQLSQHQANHARILALRSEADALEAQLKASISTLASLRQELLDTPVSTVSNDVRKIPADEIIDYATHISWHTVPPTHREPIPKGPVDADKDKDKGDAISSEVPTNGIGTPAAPNTQLTIVTEPTKDAAAGAETAEATAEDAKGPAEPQPLVTAEQAKWLEKARTPGQNPPIWVPWPNEDRIAGGNLMVVQRMLDMNRDPWTEIGPAAEAEAMAEAVRMEHKRHEQEQRDAEAARQAQAQTQRRESIAERPKTVPQQQQPAQFTGFDFDDDED